MILDQWIALAVVAIPAIGAVIVSYINNRKLHELSLSVDGRLTQLLKATGQAQRAEGIQQGAASSESIETLIREALLQALNEPIPIGLQEIHDTGLDTNARVREVQDDAATAARLAAAVATALAAKEAIEPHF